MQKSRLEIKVGLFVFLGLALLAVLLIQFSKGTSLFRGTYELHLHAANVGGIKPRAAVLLAGVQVGTVTDIQLAADGKSVTMILKIYKDYPIYHDAHFVIEQSGFLGDQYVSVNPTDNELPLLTNNAEVPCDAPFNLQEVARSASGFIQQIDGTAKKLDASVTDLRAQVLNAQTLSSFGVAMTNMRAVTEQALEAVHGIQTIVATNGPQIDTAFSNFVYFSTELTQLANSAQTILTTNGQNLNAATKNIQEISVNLKQMSADLQAGKGLAGTVLQNEELATNVQIIAANLAITSSNLNRHGLWGILWSHKAPATNTDSSTHP
ncbi:MAG: MlaD family protein [Verrucomicrobiota bacterium]|jgi:ABC-type transporter Mla subunit MlaD